MRKGVEFFVTKTSWSLVHAQGGHIQANPDACGHNNLDDLVEV